MARTASAAVLALLAALFASGALVLLTSTPAEAHENTLTSSEPPAMASLATPPPDVTLSFRWRVQPGTPNVTVTGPDGGTQWQRDTAARIGTDGRSVTVDLRQLGPAGRYQVHYRGVTGWGTPFQGTVEFTLTRPGPAMAGPPPRADGGPLVPPAWIAAVVLLTAIGMVVGVRLSRNP
ncbi:MAG TPA: copper resistance CopC family protein [Pseudonocardia sp.]|nr:copper resistance CopC family protein [Pseudonocardia sp.]